MTAGAERRHQTQMARATKRLALSQRPPKPVLRKRLRPHRRKALVVNSIPGTRGIWAELARRLDCTVASIQRSLAREGWEFVMEAFEQERALALADCEGNIFDMADFSFDEGSRLKANTFLLEKLHPDFHPSSKVVVEGGENPLRVQHLVFQIPIEILKRPVADRMAVLEAVEAQEKELNDDGSGNA